MYHMTNTLSPFSQSESADDEQQPFDLNSAIERFEGGYLRNILQLVQGDISEAARLLGIRRDRLSRKLEKYGIRD